MQSLSTDVLIVGGGTGGTAAALALTDSGLSVVMTEPTDWIGGQLTSQAVPPDEHPWIEQCGCTARYREFRERVRAWYRDHRPLTQEATKTRRLNPGSGWVSRLCFEPSIGHEVLREMVQPFVASGGFSIRLHHRPVAADVDGDSIRSVDFMNEATGETVRITARVFLDATETGDLLPLTGTEYCVGAESRSETGEPNALDGPAEWDNVQGITWCAILGYDPDGNFASEPPEQYDFWRDYQPEGWPAKLLSYKMLHVQRGEVIDFPLFAEDWFNMFGYRQIVDPNHYLEPERFPTATCMNWPMNDYYRGTILDVPAVEVERHLHASRQLTLSMIHWVQTEGGYPGIHMRPDLAGTADGLAKAPYIRESRRIKALFMVCEQHVAAYTNEGRVIAPPFEDSVGVGSYRIDLHPSSNGRPTIDTSTLPFTIPLRSLIPVRISNLIAAGKTIGVSHITNGCYRLHPVEWNIGEAAGRLAEWTLRQGESPRQLAGDAAHVKRFQARLEADGFELYWPEFRAL